MQCGVKSRRGNLKSIWIFFLAYKNYQINVTTWKMKNTHFLVTGSQYLFWYIHILYRLHSKGCIVNFKIKIALLFFSSILVLDICLFIIILYTFTLHSTYAVLLYTVIQDCFRTFKFSDPQTQNIFSSWKCYSSY